MSLHSYRGQSSNPSPDMDRVVSLSKQKLQLESARGEPDLRKLLAHVCTVEHVQGWLLANPPSREAPSQPRNLEVNAQLNELPRLSRVQSVPSMSNRWPTGEVRSIVTAVREVESDDDTDDEEGEEMSGSEGSWNGSDTSDDATFDFPGSEPQLCQPKCPPADSVCRDLTYVAEKANQTWKEMPKVL